MEQRSIKKLKKTRTKKNQVQNRYLDFFNDPSFQGVNRIFVLSFKEKDDQESEKKYYLPTVEIKGYNSMINEEKKFFRSTNKKWFKNIW